MHDASSIAAVDAPTSAASATVSSPAASPSLSGEYTVPSAATGSPSPTPTMAATSMEASAASAAVAASSVMPLADALVEDVRAFPPAAVSGDSEPHEPAIMHMALGEALGEAAGELAAGELAAGEPHGLADGLTPVDAPTAADGGGAASPLERGESQIAGGSGQGASAMDVGALWRSEGDAPESARSEVPSEVPPSTRRWTVDEYVEELRAIRHGASSGHGEPHADELSGHSGEGAIVAEMRAVRTPAAVARPGSSKHMDPSSSASLLDRLGHMWSGLFVAEAEEERSAAARYAAINV